MADIGQKFGIGGGGGPFGYKFPGFHTGTNYGYPLAGTDGSGILTTATRLYYIPFYVGVADTFTRAYTWNYDNAETGETYRTGAYANDGADGPGTLIDEFGQVTLTASAALRTQTISLDLSAYVNKWIWLVIHTNTAIGLARQLAPLESTGNTLGAAIFGSRDTSIHVADAGNQPFRYVDTAYGALASTAVAPTASLRIAPNIRLGKA